MNPLFRPRAICFSPDRTNQFNQPSQYYERYQSHSARASDRATL